jgi:hypothetical protein
MNTKKHDLSDNTVDAFDIIRDINKTLLHISVMNSCRSEKEYTEFLKDMGYKKYITPAKEIIFAEDDSLMYITRRKFNGKALYLCELNEMLLSDERIYAIGSKNRNVINAFCNFRNKSTDMSICTRNMPEIVCGLLCNEYKIDDAELLSKLAEFLSLFGSNRRMKPNRNDYNKYDILFAQTRRYICYVPEELECIAKTCLQVLKEADTVEKLEKYDINRFKTLLRKKVDESDIRLTVDIALFGRRINGWGLKESSAAVEISSFIIQ